MNQTIILDKHEMVVDKEDFENLQNQVEEAYELLKEAQLLIKFFMNGKYDASKTPDTNIYATLKRIEEFLK